MMIQKESPRYGETLPNGASVLRSTSDTVLAFWIKGSKAEYITWKYRVENGKIQTYLGKYYCDYTAANEDLTYRTGQFPV